MIIKEETIDSLREKIRTQNEFIHNVLKVLNSLIIEEQGNYIIFSRADYNDILKILELGLQCSTLPDIDKRSPDEILGYTLT